MMACLEASDADRNDFLAAYKTNAKELQDNVNAKTERGLQLKTSIHNLRIKKQRLQNEINETDKEIDAAVIDLGNNDKDKLEEIDEKAVLDSKNEICKCRVFVLCLL